VAGEHGLRSRDFQGMKDSARRQASSFAGKGTETIDT